MSLPQEKVKRTQDMIAEIKDIEAYIEKEILAYQICLDEYRKRRAILQEYLEERME